MEPPARTGALGVLIGGLAVTCDGAAPVSPRGLGILGFLYALSNFATIYAPVGPTCFALNQTPNVTFVDEFESTHTSSRMTPPAAMLETAIVS